MTDTNSFKRSTVTWLAYGMLGFYAYLQSIFAPIMPFLRAELNLNYSTGALHATAFAAGMVIAGIYSDKFTLRFGEHRAFWFGGAVMVFGAVLLAVGTIAAFTITAAFTMGLFGTLLLVMLQVVLTNQHNNHQAVALAEANIMASLCASLVPIIVGISESIGITWRGAIAIPIIAWALIFLRLRNLPLPKPDEIETKIHASKPLPRLFWLLWIGLFWGVATEWSTGFWIAEFMIQAVAVRPEVAAISVSIFLLSAFISRILASRLARHYRATYLLFGYLWLTLIGIIIFWLSRTLWLSWFGLIIIGFGIANAYPLGIGAAMRAAPKQTNKASARGSLAAALAILIAPQTLGTLADNIGIVNAFGLTILLCLAAIASTLTAILLMQNNN